MFILLIKSSSIVLLFLVSYHLFLKKETFFASNRFFLIAGLAISFVLPFITFTKTIYVDRGANLVNTLAPTTTVWENMAPKAAFDWSVIILIAYLIGVGYFSLRLLFQVLSIERIKKRGDILTEDHCHHVRTHKSISPFSFFKYIFYYPDQFSLRELESILNHEKVHVRQCHSLDILFIEISTIVLWFNPAIWLYRMALKQNLEFIADSEACGLHENKKEYQYLMLKQATGDHKITIANPFFNSIIKKRIVMLNQSKSKRIKILKLFLILPFLGLFLVGFNTKEVVKFNPDPIDNAYLETEEETFSSPLKPEDIIRISSSFGPAKNPFTKKIDFHNGIDLIASSGKNVMASADGKVELSSSTDQNGNYVVIKHKDSYSTKYLHLKDRLVKTGDKVSKGQIIGHVGNTGKSTGTHLHFEILKFKEPVNPGSLIPFKKETSNSAKTVPPIQNKETYKLIELVINKNTSDAELKQMKQDLAKDGIDLSYTAVHNENGEIIDLSLQVSGKGENGGTFNSSYNTFNEEGIHPLTISIDRENNSVSIGKKGTYVLKKTDEVVVKSEKGSHHVSVSTGAADEDSQNAKNVKISINKDGKDSNIFIMKDSDDENDIEVISENEGFFFIDSDGDINPLYVIDGNKSNEKTVRALTPDEIESINILKGDAAEKKYGSSAENGVVEITTKDKK